MIIEILPNWHPVLVHFTIALFSISTLLFLLAALIPKQSFIKKTWEKPILTTAYVNLWLGAFITIGTILAGFYAYNTVAHDTPSHLAMKDHRNWALVTASIFGVLAAWSGWKYRKIIRTNLIFLIVLIIAAGLLATTGYKGSELVYRHGLGVLSLPQAESGADGHDHEHDDHEQPKTPVPEITPTPSTPPQEGHYDDGHTH